MKVRVVKRGDPAVRKVKALPKNRNARAVLVIYACVHCQHSTDKLVEAWVHSTVHTTYKPEMGGTVMNVIWVRQQAQSRNGHSKS